MDASQYRAELSYGILNHKKLLFDFDMMAWFILYQDFGWDFEEIGRQPSEKLMTFLLLSASKSYCIKSGKKFNLTLEKLVKILENSKTAESERLKIVFAQSSRAIPEEINEKMGSGSVKKKQRGMTS